MRNCSCFEVSKQNKQALAWKILLCKEESNISLSILCQADIMVSKEMAGRPQRKAASGAAGGNYEPAENPVRPPTLLELTRCNFQPFERISSSGHNTDLKKKTDKSIPVFCQVINTCHCSMEHLVRNK